MKLNLNLKKKIIINTSVSVILCVVLAMGTAYFIVQDQNSNTLKQRIAQDKQLIEERISQNQQIIDTRINLDKEALEQRMEQDEKNAIERIEDGKKDTLARIKISGNIVLHQIERQMRSLNSVTSQLATDELYGNKLKEYVRDQNEDYLQTVFGGDKQECLQALYYVSLVNQIPLITIYDPSGKWYCSIQKSGENVHLSYAIDQTEKVFNKSLSTTSQITDYKETQSPPTIIRQYPSSIPTKQGMGYSVFNNLLWIEAWAPVTYDLYNPDTDENEKIQCGLIQVSYPLDDSFAISISNLIGMKLNVFTGPELSAGLVKDYTMIDQTIFNKLQLKISNDRVQIENMIDNEVDVSGEGFFEGIIPVYEKAKLLGALSILYSKKDLAERISIMRNKAQKNLASAKATYDNYIKESQSRSNEEIETMKKEAEAYTQKIKNDFKKNSRKMIFYMIITAVVSLLVVVPVIYLLAHYMTKPIHRVIEILNKSAKEVSMGSDQVSTSSQSLAEGASEQAASIEETSSVLEEMSAITKQNAENASAADELMKKANQVVSRASESMSELTTSMEEISKASGETSKIIQTIDEIAFKTNLLALNAAVEAARAGEAGTGFAVVADEVRNLAMRAAEAAKNTELLIQDTVRKIEGGSDLVKRNNEAFSEIIDSTSEVGVLVTDIATSSNEQSRGIDQVNQATHDMDKVVQEAAANAEDSASAAQVMHAQSTQMKKIVDRLIEIVGTRNDKGQKVVFGDRERFDQKTSRVESIIKPLDRKMTEVSHLKGKRSDYTALPPVKDDEFMDF